MFHGKLTNTFIYLQNLDLNWDSYHNNLDSLRLLLSKEVYKKEINYLIWWSILRLQNKNSDISRNDDCIFHTIHCLMVESTPKDTRNNPFWSSTTENKKQKKHANLARNVAYLVSCTDCRDNSMTSNTLSLSSCSPGNGRRSNSFWRSKCPRSTRSISTEWEWRGIITSGALIATCKAMRVPWLWIDSICRNQTSEC